MYKISDNYDVVFIYLVTISPGEKMLICNTS